MRNMTCLMILVFVCSMVFISYSHVGSGTRDTLLSKRAQAPPIVFTPN